MSNWLIQILCNRKIMLEAKFRRWTNNSINLARPCVEVPFRDSRLPRFQGFKGWPLEIEIKAKSSLRPQGLSARCTQNWEIWQSDKERKIKKRLRSQSKALGLPDQNDEEKSQGWLQKKIRRGLRRVEGRVQRNLLKLLVSFDWNKELII